MLTKHTSLQIHTVNISLICNKCVDAALNTAFHSWTSCGVLKWDSELWLRIYIIQTWGLDIKVHLNRLHWKSWDLLQQENVIVESNLLNWTIPVFKIEITQKVHHKRHLKLNQICSFFCKPGYSEKQGHFPKIVIQWFRHGNIYIYTHIQCELFQCA